MPSPRGRSNPDRRAPGPEHLLRFLEQDVPPDLTRMRADGRFRSVPIIMITSRTADKHRVHALELGVNVYLGKPYQEDELLAHIGRFVGAFAEATEN